jgi:homoserine dehydrogenase
VPRVGAIVNGAAIFVLTRMEGGADFEQALDEAHHCGYAEADPTEDVSGVDAAGKMAILAGLAFRSWVTLADVDWEGSRR